MLYLISAACSFPLMEKDVHVIDLSEPLVEGTSLMFACPSGLTLIGPNAIMCLENGQWEPDPSQVKCKGNYSFCSN